MFEKISLTQGFETIIDDEDYDYLSQFNWRIKRSGNIVYAARHGRKRDGSRTGFLMHREIMDAQKGVIIDHINGNSLDNRKSNLRIVTHRQNLQNRHTKTSSKYPGVSWNKEKNKWESSIGINNKKKFLGYFDNEISAFHAYKNKLDDLGESLI